MKSVTQNQVALFILIFVDLYLFLKCLNSVISKTFYLLKLEYGTLQSPNFDVGIGKSPAELIGFGNVRAIRIQNAVIFESANEKTEGFASSGAPTLIPTSNSGLDSAKICSYEFCRSFNISIERKIDQVPASFPFFSCNVSDPPFYYCRSGSKQIIKARILMLDLNRSAPELIGTGNVRTNRNAVKF